MRRYIGDKKISEIIENDLFGGAEYLCAEVLMILNGSKFKCNQYS